MHDRLFRERHAGGEERLVEIAGELGLGDSVAVDGGVPMFRPNQTVTMTIFGDYCPRDMTCTDDSDRQVAIGECKRADASRADASLETRRRARRDGTLDDDVIYGATGSDTIHGKACHDTIWGGSGRDRLFGDDGDDHLYGQRGKDTIYGGRGDDTIHGGQGDDVCYGGPGRDNFTSCRFVYPG